MGIKIPAAHGDLGLLNEMKNLCIVTLCVYKMTCGSCKRTVLDKNQTLRNLEDAPELHKGNKDWDCMGMWSHGGGIRLRGVTRLFKEQRGAWEERETPCLAVTAHDASMLCNQLWS